MIDFALQKTLHTSEGEMLLRVNSKIESGQFVGLYGVSGAGKTSILRMLAGFMSPDKGSITTKDAIWFDDTKKINVPSRHRKIGFVFQDYALFPNMTVRENLTFALSKNESTEIVEELLDLTGLSNLVSKKPDALSGGQQQRVALARAIARKPDILLLDEPLSAIDSATRLQLQETLAKVHKRFGLTTILVSHNENEIIKLADTVLHLEKGAIQRKTTPAQFFSPENPADGLIGTIVSVDDNGDAILMIDRRVLRISLPREQIIVGNKIELDCSPKPS